MLCLTTTTTVECAQRQSTPALLKVTLFPFRLKSIEQLKAKYFFELIKWNADSLVINTPTAIAATTFVAATSVAITAAATLRLFNS